MVFSCINNHRRDALYVPGSFGYDLGFESSSGDRQVFLVSILQLKTNRHAELRFYLLPILFSGNELKWE
jgi:hypothetical protein